MPQGNCTHNATPGETYFYLQNASDVIPLMTVLLQIKWNSTLRAYLDANGAANWDLQIVNMNTDADQLAPQDRQKVMHLGDVVVYDPTTTRLSTMRVEDFQSSYSVN